MPSCFTGKPKWLKQCLLPSKMKRMASEHNHWWEAGEDREAALPAFVLPNVSDL